MRTNYRKIAHQSLLDLATEDGINASGKDELFGCTFGRDTALTVIKILNVLTKKPDPELSAVCRRALLTLVRLQGQETNPESGENPGKILHEYRKDRYDHLVNPTNPDDKPWYLYPDKTLRNYDSLDSTPLTLIALHKYWSLTKDYDKEFLIQTLPAVEAGLNWMITYGDQDKDFLLEYSLPPERQFGGLRVQSWTDSTESLLQADGKFPNYPIAPVEVQGYGWLAFKLWGHFYANHPFSPDSSPAFGQRLLSQANQMKKQFNQSFIIKDHGLYFAAQALDGDKNQIKTITANPLLLLWASFDLGPEVESILDKKYVDDFVTRGFRPDLFDKTAGIRTMSTEAATYDSSQNSYHNGSFWPIINGLIHEGLVKHGYKKEAARLLDASLQALGHFGSAMELYTKQGQQYLEYRNPSGQTSCKQQAWTAASWMEMLDQRSNRTRIMSQLKGLAPYNLLASLPTVRLLPKAS